MANDTLNLDALNERDFARVVAELERLRTERAQLVEALRTLATNVKTAAEMANQRPEATEPGSFAGMMRAAARVWPGMAMAAALLDREVSR